MEQNGKIDLGARTVESARRFLTGFDSANYKEFRRALSEVRPPGGADAGPLPE